MYIYIYMNDEFMVKLVITVDIYFSWLEILYSIKIYFFQMKNSVYIYVHIYSSFFQSEETREPEDKRPRGMQKRGG